MASQTTSAEQLDTPKMVTKNMICNPTPRAYRIAAIKARMRAANRQDPANYNWQRELKRHTKAVETAFPKIDTSTPNVRKVCYQETVPFNKGLVRQIQIDSENGQLLRNLAAIYNGELKCGVQTRLSPYCKPVKNKAYPRAIKALELMRENIQKFENLQNTKAVYSTLELSKWYVKQQKHMDRIAKYPTQAEKSCPLLLRRVMEKAYKQPRQYAYLMVEVEDKQAENLVIELFADLCPFTVKNFQRLCTNTKATACDCRTYRCKKIESIHSVQVMDGSFKKLYWVVGENVDSTVEYSTMMSKESSEISHTIAGLVTKPKSRAGGTFFITVGPCPHLDKFCYVFGRIKGKGLEFLKTMEQRNTTENGEILIPIHITDCGIVSDPSKVPPPMLLQDFIQQARLELVPITKKDVDEQEDWEGKQAAFAEYLMKRVNDARDKIAQSVTEATTMAEYDHD